GMDTMAAMEAAGDGKIDAAVLLGGNLYAANPDSDWAARALDQIGFRLCLTTTLNASHVFGVESGEMLVLPVAARDEEWEPTTQESMFNYVRLSDGGITRLADVRPESAILADIGARLLPNGPIDFDAFKRHRSVRQAIAAIVPGMEALADIDVAKREFHVRNRLMHTPEFLTSNSKARFKTHASQTPVGSGDEVWPFTLMTVRSEGQFNSIIYEHKDTYRGTDTRWSVLMNKQDMDAAGLKPGDRADLRSEHGVMTGVKVYSFDLPRGDVMAYYPEANVLTSRAVDPRSKTPAFKSTPIAIAPTSGA
ncbi:MAG: molybdopterin dinucleotide binding domain-containing protein, partial [Pseudomonadota bacterium]